MRANSEPPKNHLHFGGGTRNQPFGWTLNDAWNRKKHKSTPRILHFSQLTGAATPKNPCWPCSKWLKWLKLPFLLNILGDFLWKSFNPWAVSQISPNPTSYHTPHWHLFHPATTRHLIAKALPQGQVPQGIFYRLKVAPSVQIPAVWEGNFFQFFSGAARYIRCLNLSPQIGIPQKKVVVSSLVDLAAEPISKKLQTWKRGT